MKRFFQLLMCGTLFLGITAPAWGQASTQGTEFWVSSTLACSPDKATPTPYIAVSAEKACTVTIQGGVGNAINIVQNVAAGSWNEFGNNSKPEQKNPQAGLINVHMDASKWYPTNMSDANNVSTLAAQKNMYGLHITATENVSVYVILSSQHSMDASNILPMTALGSEYYTQDYWSKVKSGFDNAVGLTTILGTEDNTQIDITPNGDTFDGWVSGSTHQITLNKGQTYYLVTKKADRLAGTHIMAKNGKKIAVYCGVPITNIPSGIAARDCLFEQPMPVEYWGTQFIVTRSLEKNGNLIGITATQNNTKIKVDGYQQASINEGDTYYIMLQGQGDPNAKNPGEQPIDLVLTQDAAYIETSCPCAVYSYDTGNSYKGNSEDEIVNGQGDPSSVWVSPIQQKIGKITFGTCYTSKTKDHFLNVVTETATCQKTTLTAIYGQSELPKTNLLKWQPVPGNTKYSYARAKIGDSNTSKYSVFRLENPRGFIATIYGNGDDESYAYSAGSAAVEQGINVNGVTFTDGYRSEEKFCMTGPIEFDASIGTDEIKRVDWDFGDGTTEPNGEAQTTHQYTAPGWYDVTAQLFGHQVCTNNPDVDLGKVEFTFRIWRKDTITVIGEPECISLDGKLDGKTLTPQEIADKLANGDKKIVPGENCYDSDTLKIVKYSQETETKETLQKTDFVEYEGVKYYEDTIITDTAHNEYGCKIFNRHIIHPLKCHDFALIPFSEIHLCPGEIGNQSIEFEYTKSKGDIQNPVRCIIYNQIDQNDTLYNNDFNITENTGTITIALPEKINMNPGIYHCILTVGDAMEGCEAKIIDVLFYVNYPSDIFKYKFNNVLAVYKPGYGGNKIYDNPSNGWEFTAYQWYVIRESRLLDLSDNPTATTSVFYLGEGNTFEIGDRVFVVLTDKVNNAPIPSCPQTINEVPDYNQKQSNAPAKKMIQNQHLVIQKGDELYDIYGQRIQ